MIRRAIDDSDRNAIAQFIEQRWHSQIVMSHGRAYYPHLERGFIEWRDDRIAGLLTYVLHDTEMEILTLDAVLEGQGIGSALTLVAIDHARRNGITRIWLTTTNDNLRAIGFYQRLGFRICQVNMGVVDEARKIKPQIPEVGEGGIPIHDELVLELRLKPATHGTPEVADGNGI